MSSRKVRMTAPSGYNGEALKIGDEPDLPTEVADRLILRGRAVEIGAAVAAPAADAAPAPIGGRKRHRGAAVAASAPAADPVEAVETGVSTAPGAALPEISETE